MSVMIGVRIPKVVRDLAKKVAEGRGMHLSDYVRELIFEDLDKKRLFPSRETGILEIPSLEKEA